MNADSGVTKILTDYKKARPWWHYLPPIALLLVVRYIVTWLLGSWIMDVIHLRGGRESFLGYWSYQVSRGKEKKTYKTLLKQKTETPQKVDDFIQSKSAPAEDSAIDVENTNQPDERRKFKLYHPKGVADFYVKKKPDVTEENTDKIFFVHFNNAGDKYSQINLPEFKFSSTKKQNRVDIFVNHTGTGSILFGHRRHNMEDLYLTGEVVLHYLLNDLNIPAEKIIVCGWSLGSVVGAKVVNRFQNNGQKIKLISDRSFTTVPDLLVGWCGRGIVDAWKRTGGAFFWNNGIMSTIGIVIVLLIYSLTVTALCLAGALIAVGLVPLMQRLTGTTISGGWDFHQVDKKTRLAFESTRDHFVNPPAKLSWSLFRKRIGDKDSDDVKSNRGLGHFDTNRGCYFISDSFFQP